MKTKLLLICSFLLFISTQAQNKLTKNQPKKGKTTKFIAQKPDAKTLELRKCHAENLVKSPFTKTLKLTKKERRAMGIPPNKYFETEWELTMNPETGKPDTQNLIELRKKLLKDREELAGRTPGDAVDNNWIERGPTNVGGRTRAVMFDPNDATNETVFAGGVSGGLWKNTNISNPNSVWARVGIPENLAVSCITVDPNNSNVFYIGTGESYVGGDVNGDGVWKSLDGGATWTNIFGGISGPIFFNNASVFTVNSPSSIVGDYIMVEAPQTFGTFPAITTPITGDIVLADDGTAFPTEGCSAFTNAGAMAGKIALIRRGTCNFTVKIKNAQNAGAIAAILMNNNTDAPFAMGGSDPTITIPAVMITQADGNMLQNALLTENVNLSLNPSNGSFTGFMLPGVQHVNSVRVRNNAGISEIYVAAADGFYSSSGTTTFLGGTTYGLYKSIDGGTSWTEVALPLTATGKKHCPNDIEFGSDNKIWLSTIDSYVWGEGGGKIFSSTDGNTFIERYQIPNANRTQIAVSSTIADKVYALAEVSIPTPATETVSILSTTDGFATTPTILALPDDPDGGIPANDFTRGQAGYDLVLEVDPSNDQKVFVGGINIFDSTNGGTSWTRKSDWTGSVLQEVHADQHAASFSPTDASKMVFGNDGGVFYSNDSGNTISVRNNGFNVTQFYSLGVAPTTNGMPGDNFVAGAQDNGSQMFLNATPGQNAAVEVQGGDGAFSMFDQDGVDQYRITNYVYNNTIRLYNYVTGVTRSLNTETAVPGNGSFINPMTLDSRLDILYSEYFTNPNYRIRRYKNVKSGAIQKAPLSNPMLNSAGTALTVSPYISATSTSTLLIGTRNGRLIKLENADAGTFTLGATAVWTNISGPGFVGSISDVEYGNSENEIFVTFHNYNVVSIWYTADGGVTWQNKEGNFPDIPVKAVLRNPLNVDEVIIGTELGVWYTNTFNTASPIWLQSYNGMSNVKVTDLDLRNDNVVYAATYGRGIFSGAFTAPSLSNINFENTNEVVVSPNPSNGLYSIQIKDISSRVNVKVVDINGKEVFSKNDVDADQIKSIDLSNLQSGVYILNVNGQKLNYTEKLIKN
jgi:PA domain/Secretion system C-terminal sorting domain